MGGAPLSRVRDRPARLPQPRPLVVAVPADADEVVGRALHPAYLVEVKKPSESKGPYDYYKIRATIPADQAFRPEKDGGCNL